MTSNQVQAFPTPISKPHLVSVSLHSSLLCTNHSLTIRAADRELNRTLQSMACGKHRILTKTPKSRDVSPTDTFILNLSFHDEKFRIKINQIQLKETKEENEETHERVAQDRQYETQAAIIRIMKARKKIRHLELIQQTIEQTRSRGVLDGSEIKRNIEK